MSKPMILFMALYSLYVAMLTWEHLTSEARIGWTLAFMLIPLAFYLWGYIS